jgi:hypothetical protein
MSDETADPAAQADETPGGQPAQAGEKKAKEKKPAKAKESKAKADKGKSKGKGKSSGGLSVATHPRAHAAVRRAKGWGGLLGFGIAAYLSVRAGVPPEQVGLRALAAGAAGYMVAWGVSVTVWRHLLMAELRARYENRKPAAAGIPIKGPGAGPKEDGKAPGLTQ